MKSASASEEPESCRLPLYVVWHAIGAHDVEDAAAKQGLRANREIRFLEGMHARA